MALVLRPGSGVGSAANIVIEISIIIPTYNRPGRLRACLESLARQTHPSGDFEVVVIVDGATPAMRRLLETLATPYLLNVIWQENQGQCRALNRGLQAAQGRYCLFLDDDMVASPHLVAEHLRAQQSRERVVALGQITLRLPPDADAYARSLAHGWAEHYRELNEGRRAPTWEDCYSGNLSAPRALVLEAGGFDDRLARGFDVELAHRLGRAGAQIMYLPEALSDQDQRKGYRALLADAENAGASEFAVYQRGGQVLSQEMASFSWSWRKFLLRRVLLALRVPPQWLAYLARLVAHPGRRLAWIGFVQTYCYWRGVQRAAGSGSAWRQLTQGVPILMYHALGRPGEKPGRYIMPATRYARQMAWLRRLGYRVIGLDEYADCRHSRRLPPPRSVVLTLDDGYADSRGLAAPILTHYRFPATVFLVSGRLGSANRWDHHGELAGRPLLSRSDAAEMNAAGIGLGAHTRSHPSLPSLSSDDAWDEIDGSRRDLKALLGAPISCFAYPYGEYNADIQALAERSGFRLACTADAGLNTLATPLHALRRAEIYGTDGWLRFLLALWFGDAAAIFPRRWAGPVVAP